MNSLKIKKNDKVVVLSGKDRGKTGKVLGTVPSEAKVVAVAGRKGAVTVATNMAGRGTDIMLGGNAEYLAKNDLRKAGF